MSGAAWHPRGEPSWPDWRDAKPGTRFEHVRNGARGTFVGVSPNRNNGAIVDWDARHAWQHGKPTRGVVVAPAFDLRPLS
jgi:hypothetical protein